MLVIRVEIWPGGDNDHAREIARMGIANVSSLQDVSDYIYVSATDRGQRGAGIIRRHRRENNLWGLVSRAASAAQHRIDETAVRPLPHRFISLADDLRRHFMRKSSSSGF